MENTSIMYYHYAAQKTFLAKKYIKNKVNNKFVVIENWQNEEDLFGNLTIFLKVTVRACK